MNERSAMAKLVLEDGTVFHGFALGSLNQRASGELVFTTSMTGYQETITDPSYAGQVIVFTYPEIGNYGITKSDSQSAKPRVRGIVIRSLCERASSWRADEDLEGFLRQHNIPGIGGIDTRALTRRIRDSGAMRAILSTEDDIAESELLAEVRFAPQMNGQNLSASVRTQSVYTVMAPTEVGRVVVLDYGLKQNMLDLLTGAGLSCMVFPGSASLEDITRAGPDGIFLSNGPGDPAACLQEVDMLRELLLKWDKPMFAVCLGHQLLALALGAKTFKLKFGHRGSNHPVKCMRSGRVFITSQNHGFAVEESSLSATEFCVSYKSLNDGTVEGLHHNHRAISSVQFHPEACPGPSDTRCLFQQFAATVIERARLKGVA